MIGNSSINLGDPDMVRGMVQLFDQAAHLIVVPKKRKYVRGAAAAKNKEMANVQTA